MKTLSLAALALGMCLAPAQAQDAPAPRPRMGDRLPKVEERFDRALRLTDAQKASVKEIRARHKAAIDAKRATAETSRKAFEESIRNPEAKSEDLKALHRTQADANLDLLLEHRAQRLEIRAILTPEQREKAARLLGRMEGLRMRHPGGMPGGAAR
jgi:Spy/CpxP family protein refolding chaperone